MAQKSLFDEALGQFLSPLSLPGLPPQWVLAQGLDAVPQVWAGAGLVACASGATGDSQPRASWRGSMGHEAVAWGAEKQTRTAKGRRQKMDGLGREDGPSSSFLARLSPQLWGQRRPRPSVDAPGLHACK